MKCQENKLNNNFFTRDKSKEITKLNKVEKCKTRSVTSLKSNTNVQKLFSDYGPNQNFNKNIPIDLEEISSRKVNGLVNRAFTQRDMN